MIKIKVKTSTRTYPVIIGNSIFEELPDTLKKINVKNNLLIIIDENVFKYHKSLIKKTFSNFRNEVKYYILPPGEESKSEKYLKNIYSFLLKNGFGRDSSIISIGGGVTGDIAAYTASTYMRGINLVQIPTTLLGMVDSSVGGKTGINFKKRKNLIGTFYQPNLVLIDTDFLATLPEREFTSAFGELIKYGIIAKNDFLSLLRKNLNEITSLDNKILIKVIKECVLIKASIVSQDELELTGVRKLLNFGHTFAHAFESCAGFELRHGEAVIKGIICSLYLSHMLGLLNRKELKRLLILPCNIKIAKLPKRVTNDQILNAMKADKKNFNDKIMLVISAGSGNILVDYPIERKLIIQVLNKVKSDGLV